MNKSKTLVLYAITFALMIVFGLLPYVFLLPLLFICVTADWKMAAVSGLMFGVISFCYAFAGSSLVALAFIEAPWIPIVPRLLVGIGTHFAFSAAKKIVRGEGKFARSLPYAIAGAVGSILNTGLVVTCLILFTPDLALNGVVMYVYAPTLLIAGAIELAVNTLLLPPIALTVQKALRMTPRKALERKEESDTGH